MAAKQPYGRPPYHPDFDILSGAVMQSDALSESGVMTVVDLVKEVADPETAMHFAVQRGAMVARLTGVRDIKAATAMAGAWLDGMVAGYRLRQAHEQKEAEDRD